MNIVKLFMASAALTLVAVGCSLDEKVQIENPSDLQNVFERKGRTYPIDAFIPGVISVKVSEEMFANIDIRYDENGKILTSGVSSLDDFIHDMGVTEMVRIFPDGGKFEARRRKAGLHLWFDMFFDEKISLTRATRSVKGIEGIDCIELNPKIELYDNNLGMKVMPLTATEPQEEGTAPFNDPLLSRQWHYYNDGNTETGQGIAGADINVFPVWEKGVVGDPEVIVAVLDEGIDYNHEDLADNMWSTILDDDVPEDGTLIHGACFGKKTGIVYTLNPGKHGTHVAGTVAAVNNNNKGVCGVAGGDYANGKPGVKLMSLQLWDEYGNDSQRAGEAMAWAADHGAIISQNSWGYPPSVINYMPEDDKAGIDYFIDHAGIDENGNQVGPMRGGIVIFAAGNESSPMAYPSSYERCLTVGSILSDYELAPYSNYGSWVDIAATGGSWKNNANNRIEDWVYSTLPGNDYGWNSGTSMACPHVSGVAALVLSEHKGNITPEELRSILIMGVKNISQYNKEHEGQYGSGLIDAERCVNGLQIGGDEIAPISDLEVNVKADMVYFSMTMPTSESKASTLYILYSANPITEDNYLNSRMKSFEVSSLNPGETISDNFSTGIFNSTIYVAAIIVDENGLKSSLSNVEEAKTVENAAPVIEALDGADLNIKTNQVLTCRFVITDPDGHKVTPSISPVVNYITYDYTGALDGNDTLLMRFNGNLVGEKEGIVTLTVKDEYGLESQLQINYTFKKNHTPVLINPKLPEITLRVGDAPYAFEFTDEYILEMDNDPLTIMVTTDTTGNGIVNVSTDGPVIYIEPVGVGSISLKMLIMDPVKSSAEAVLNVKVLPADPSAKPEVFTSSLNIYPNPVVDVLNIVSKEGEIKGGQVVVYAASGSIVFEQQMDIHQSTPATIDMSAAPAGTYSVAVITTTQKHISNFVKL